MRILTALLTITAAALLAGCQGGGAPMMGVDFEQQTPLRYEFSSDRQVEIDWGRAQRTGDRVQDTITQSVTMVVLYEPLDVQPFGASTIKATVESVQAQSAGGRSFGRTDAVTHLQGKSWTFTVDPAGRITDRDQLLELTKETAEKAFDALGDGKVKNPDMTDDFLAAQWFLWDAPASVPNPSRGIQPGRSWQSHLFIPAPWITQHAREVTYTLEDIKETDQGTIALISEQYAPAQQLPQNWPLQYSGSFQMRGQFGFLRGYKLEGLTGRGSQSYNLDTGILLSHSQSYQAQLSSSMPMSLGVTPKITLDQTIEIKLLD